jgi:hypothetical protein
MSLAGWAIAGIYLFYPAFGQRVGDMGLQISSLCNRRAHEQTLLSFRWWNGENYPGPLLAMV